MSEVTSSHQAAGFPATAWTCTHKAGDPQHEEHATAMNRLASAYWKPIFCFLRARGHPLDRATDLTQAVLPAHARKRLDRGR